LEKTHLNLNDSTLEGLYLPDLKAFSVQYHPEAAPGPHDAAYLFKEFISLMKQAREKQKAKGRKTHA
jgi:carbamoyl-phosphate synthase small subunit